MKLPDPLHPAIVHFPIVLILLGTAIAVIALVFRRAALAWFAAVVLAMAATGSLAAAWSGDEDEDAAEHAGAVAGRVLEEHEEWGERTRNAAITAMLAAAVAAVSIKRFPIVSRGAAVLTAAFALTASWCVIQAGHYGGQLVYQHGVGVKSPAEAKSARTQKHHHHHD